LGLTLRDAALLVRGTLVGDGAVVVNGVGPIETARRDQIAALDSERFLDAARASQAAALLVTPKLAAKLDKESGRPHIVTPAPQIAQNLVIEKLGLWPLAWTERGRHPSAIVAADAEIGADVAIDAFAVVGPRARIGAGTRLDPHAVVEGGAIVGARCRILSHAVICAPATIGDDCLVGHGAVVGGEGFGFGFGPTGAVRLHHIGRVVVGNRVDIGNCATIDRARFGETRVGDDVKLDSHVHLGHNVTIGARTVCAAQTGIAGSSTVGESCLLGGQAGVADHVTIPTGTRISAKGGVPFTLDAPGDYSGHWVRPFRTAAREFIALEKLPGALKEIERLRAELEVLKSRLA